MQRWVRVFKRFNMALGIGALVLLTVAPLALVEAAVAAESDAAPAAEAQQTDVMTSDAHAKMRCWAFVAAALATGIGSLAAGYAVATVGTAAMGAVAEKPELMGKSLIYVALAEGIAIYGLLIAIITLAKV